jgi:hypothetical protein
VTRKVFLVLLALVLALSVGLVACGGAGEEEEEEEETYDLTITSTTGGSTTPAAGTHTYDDGDVVNLVATADAGYQFINWTGNVGTIDDVNDATTTITMNGNYDITANFRLLVYNSLEYFPITLGYGIKYHVTDTSTEIPVNCNVWAVSQYCETGLPDDLDFVFTLIREGTTGGYYCPCSLGGQMSFESDNKEFIAFFAGAPSGNQGSFYMNFCLPAIFADGDQWTMGTGDITKTSTV